MSSRALTVTLNFDHSKKFVLLLPESASGTRKFYDQIIRDAKNKFRTKGISTVFLQGGTLFTAEATLPEGITQVWVGKGEPYAGPSDAANFWTTGARPEDIRIIASKSYIDDAAVKQLQTVARLPGVRMAVGMPDLHPGGRFPIGCAIAAEGIYPALIGSDVGCGIAVYRLSSTAARARANPKKIASLLTRLDEPWSGSVSTWLTQYGIERTSPFDREALGTVGAGNHFAEICSVEKIVDSAAAASVNIEEDALYLLVHTGSRGLGNSILQRETVDNSNPYIPATSPHLDEYLVEHDYAVKWAVANRDLVAHRIRDCLSAAPTPADSSASSGLPHLSLAKVLDVTHNSVTKHALELNGVNQQLWVHRKGAAPADAGVCPCPGSRGDFSWLLQPTGDGQLNAHSLAHGAGRRYGRQVLHTGAKINKSALTTTALGSEVVCLDSDLLIEERPEAYKDVQCVVEDMEEEGISRGVVVFRPIVTYKVREGQ